MVTAQLKTKIKEKLRKEAGSLEDIGSHVSSGLGGAYTGAKNILLSEHNPLAYTLGKFNPFDRAPSDIGRMSGLYSDLMNPMKSQAQREAAKATARKGAVGFGKSIAGIGMLPAALYAGYKTVPYALSGVGDAVGDVGSMAGSYMAGDYAGMGKHTGELLDPAIRNAGALLGGGVGATLGSMASKRNPYVALLGAGLGGLAGQAAHSGLTG
jgi:hypothetical protein